MSLLGKEKALIKKDYFQVWEIVEMLREYSNGSWEDVGEFLGHYNFDTELTLYCRDGFHRMHEVRNDYAPIRNLIHGLNVAWLEGEESIQKIKIDIIGYYWAKDEIYNLKPLINLNIIAPPEPNAEYGEQNTQSNIAPIKNIDFSKLYLYKTPLLTLHEAACIISENNPEEVDMCRNDSNFPEYFASYLRALSFLDACVGAGEITCHFDIGSRIDATELKSCLHKNGIIIAGFNDDLQGAELEKNTDANNIELQQLKLENEKLKAELAEKDQKIKELESLNPKNDMDLLSLIFDESATEIYAPDLVNAIKLWKYLYVDNKSANDSHSSRANHWIVKNTPYKGESTIEVKRLREVTSPFNGWHSERKNKLNK